VRQYKPCSKPPPHPRGLTSWRRGCRHVPQCRVYNRAAKPEVLELTTTVPCNPCVGSSQRRLHSSSQCQGRQQAHRNTCRQIAPDAITPRTTVHCGLLVNNQVDQMPQAPRYTLQQPLVHKLPFSCPPPTVRETPVIHAVRSEARITTASATSGGIPIRPHGMAQGPRRRLFAGAC